MNNEPAIDPLSEILRFLHPRILEEGRLEFVSPWGIVSPSSEHKVSMILIGKGNCCFEAEGHPSISLGSGDALLIAGKVPFTIHDGSGANVRPVQEVATSGSGACGDEDGAEHWMLRSVFDFHGALAPMVLALLAPITYLPSNDGCYGRWMSAMFSVMCSESRQNLPGSSYARHRYAELFLLQFLRATVHRHSEGGKSCSTMFLKVLFDPQLGPAVARIHQDPGHDWTVAKLAETVSMSRTAFAVRFTEVAGMPPLTYVTKWRMIGASEKIRQGDTLTSIAAGAGYDSDAAFSRAFKREMDMSPGAYRRSVQRI